MTGRAAQVGPLAKALLRRPDLWPSALRFVPPGWWRRRPPSPVPPGDYLHFRMETMYGTDGRMQPDELIRYLEWCRRVRPPAR